MTTEQIVLSVEGLKKYFPIRRGLLRRVVGNVKAVDDVSFKIARGETLSLVGESGCGKTTTSRCILRAIRPTAGAIQFRTDESRNVNVADMTRTELRPLRRQMQMIFQDPYSSLNPRMSVGQIIGEPMAIHGLYKGAERTERIQYIMQAVGLNPLFVKRFPHEFSGGQRQRIGIGRALAVEPDFIACDEPVSALDVSIQAQVINLLEDLQEQFGLTYLFIAHDLSVVEHISTRIAVMYLGRVVEIAPAAELYDTPLHPYSEALLSAVPIPDPTIKRKRIMLQGDVPNPIRPPSGCHFHTRCPIAKPDCATRVPELRESKPGHWVSCHYRG